ncbi:MAG: SIMPL domain-containing protein [Caldilineaceae bacterium]|nr:SIMPL domain-containing protein [Caldilineaceae bacterium]MCY4089676.1 SIMPL domain-containing protein [Caldilineaceae bacterium]
MKNRFLVIVCALALALLPATSLSASAAEELLPEPEPTLSVLGFGTASAVPDSVQVKVQLGQEPSFGPGAPQFEIPDAAGLERVRSYLIENGVAESSIQVEFFSRNFPLGMLMPGSSISFSYPDPDGLRDFLQTMVVELAAERGPAIQDVQFAYLVDDCGVIEEAAMKTALENAKKRAETLAVLLQMSVGRIISVAEDNSANVAVGASGGCIALTGLRSFGIESVMGMMSPLTNSAEKVEVGILLRATFALEP